MAKIIVLEQKTYNNKPSGFKVTLDDGRSGNLEEKQSDKGLRVGDEVVVTEIPYTSKAGNHSTLYGLRLIQNSGTQSQAQTPASGTFGVPPQPPRPAIHVGAGKSKEEMKAVASIKILLKLLDFFKEAKLESAQISVTLKEYDRLIWSEIDEIYSGK